MMRTSVASRLYRSSLLQQQHASQRSTSTAAISVVTSTAQRGFSTGSLGGAETDEASARKAALLRRYGDRTASSGPIAVKADVAAADAMKMTHDEANHNEIWGDYVRYMEHQRKKGWKT